MNGRQVGIAVVTMLMAVAGARAEDGLGIGVIVGEPTGLSVKKWISPTHAIDGALAWSFSENDSFQIHADYLFHDFNVVKIQPGRLPLYAGLGVRVKVKSDDNGHGRNEDDALIGIRVPFGLSYLLDRSPLDLFAEIVPILDVAPDTDFDLNLAVGARFYFR